ncbi:MAG: glutathione S-transferase [Acinetobacter sp.]|nr:glutathione S-transferase [Acinetobacter sp.]
MRILYQFPLSPYCEKARWILDFKELHYIAQNLTPGVHRAFTQLKTKQNKLPILRDGDSWIADSRHIALYLDDIYPEHRIIRPQHDLHDAILAIDAQANILGQHVRRWCLASLSVQDRYALEVLLGERGYARKFSKLTKPILQKLMQKAFQLNADDVQSSKQQMQHIIAQLNAQVEQQGEFLVGGKLSLADMSVASMLAPLLQLAETPWEQAEQQHFSQEFTDYQAQLSEMAIGQYVKNLYQHHRHALVDWRGV